MLFHNGGEEKLRSFVPLRPGLGGKNYLEISDYLKKLIFSQCFCRSDSMAKSMPLWTKEESSTLV
jgi:hypothetical protein